MNKCTIYAFTYRYTINGTGYEVHSFFTQRNTETGDTPSARDKTNKPEISHTEGMNETPFSFCFRLL
jgi:hypothetical protein